MSTKVFISYSHLDDRPFGPRDLCWVQSFEHALLETLGQRIGRGRVELWRDKRRMDGATRFDDEIRTNLHGAELLITVLSRNYLDSDYCRDELQMFGTHWLGAGGLKIGGRSRIVKVYRTAIDRGDLRRFAERPGPQVAQAAPVLPKLPQVAAEIDSTEGFRLFCVDGDTERDALLHRDGMDLVWQKADDLACTIKRIVDEAAPVLPGLPPPPSSGVVYLARTASDMAPLRDALRRELEDRRFEVLPAAELPEEGDAYADAVRADLARARLSIHLLGQRYGAIPEGSAESGIALQARLALAAGHAPFTTLLWSPDGGEPPDERMAALRQALAGQSYAARRAEYLRGELDQFKALVLARLTEEPAPAVQARDAAPRIAYLICDASDRGDTRALKTALEAQGFEVVRPLVEGTPEELLEEHQRNLVACGVAIIAWGKVREPWVRAKLRDLQQATGWGRSEPLRARIVLVGPPDSEAKQHFDPPAGVHVLQATDLVALQGLLS
ncbi:MAG TPA: TIR domain-containing protein [Burkholderiaceae bacterium]|nr:TIR domain-containing protein [Burkholderiaceae bacterium]